MKAISIKQPWAYLIASGIKDIENRTWKCPEKYIGTRVLIHASAKPANIGFEVSGQATVMEIQLSSALNKCEEEGLFSAIIGSVEIVDCAVNHTSIWAEKTKLPTIGDVLEDIHFLRKAQKPNPIIYNWVIANPIIFDEPIMNVKGKLGFWEYNI